MEREFERRYELFARPLEAEHWGEYIAVYKDGRLFMGQDLTEVAIKAKSEAGKGFFLFKVGERAVGNLL
jgi:hypothetical protein